MSKCIRLIVVEDHPVTMVGIVSVLTAAPDIEVCGEAATVAQAEQLIHSEKPDVVVTDLYLSQQDGLERIKSWTAQFPKTPLVVVSMHDEDVYGERALQAGAMAYVMKSEATRELVEAVQAVATGKRHVSSNMAMKVVNRVVEGKGNDDREWLYALTDRELHVFQLLGAGLRPREIAAEMKLSVKTVGRYQENLKNKLTLHSARDLVSRAEAYVREQIGN